MGLGRVVAGDRIKFCPPLLRIQPAGSARRFADWRGGYAQVGFYPAQFGELGMHLRTQATDLRMHFILQAHDGQVQKSLPAENGRQPLRLPELLPVELMLRTGFI